MKDGLHDHRTGVAVAVAKAEGYDRLLVENQQLRASLDMHKTCEHRSGCWGHELDGHLILRCLLCREPVSVGAKR